jgi:hypothetical protein
LYAHLLERSPPSAVVILFRINITTVLFIASARSLFGGSSVQQSVPAVDLTSDAGQNLTVFIYWKLM